MPPQRRFVGAPGFPNALRQVSLVAGLLFPAFTAFWTTLVFLLKTPPHHYGAQAAGLFGPVGATGRSLVVGHLASS